MAERASVAGDEVDRGELGAAVLADEARHQIGEAGITEPPAQQLDTAACQPATAGTAQLDMTLEPVRKTLLHTEVRRVHPSLYNENKTRTMRNLPLAEPLS